MAIHKIKEESRDSDSAADSSTVADGESIARSWTMFSGSEVNTPPESVSPPDGMDYESDHDIIPGNLGVTLAVEPLADSGGAMIQIVPPTEPADEISHVNNNIVLVIDVSSSMSIAAPPPVAAGQTPENTGLSVLDLVKHAAKTIVKSLDKDDRLSIVTFEWKANNIQDLLPMTEANKESTIKKIESLAAYGATNLNAGILTGIENIAKEKRPNQVSAVLVLTDGEPNQDEPLRGYVHKLRSLGKLPCSVHTYGFGYRLNTGLLKSIAEVGGGSYAFIPDSGMIGTVFVHAVANLQSTFATGALLSVSCPSIEIYDASGPTVFPQSALEKVQRSTGNLIIPVNNLQYGQPRQYIVKCKKSSTAQHPVNMEVILTCSFGSKSIKLVETADLSQATSLPASTIDYHLNRTSLCSLLSSFYPIGSDGQRRLRMNLAEAREALGGLISTIKGQGHPEELNESLVLDLCGHEPDGQISLALSKEEYHTRWGQHYLPAVLDAYSQQRCNTFKDAGPLMFGRDSPLFNRCRDILEKIFESMGPPTPSVKTSVPISHNYNMSAYYNRAGPCFAGNCSVRLAQGATRVENLRPGMSVWTPAGYRNVAAVVATPVYAVELRVVDDLLVTPWHPVKTGQSWSFPADCTEERTAYTGNIYSILLEPSEDPECHGVEVGGVLAVTLGHGIERGDDARAHAFFGNYSKIVQSLNRLYESNGQLRSSGVAKDPLDGLVYDFVPDQSFAPATTELCSQGAGCDRVVLVH